MRRHALAAAIGVVVGGLALGALDAGAQTWTYPVIKVQVDTILAGGRLGFQNASGTCLASLVYRNANGIQVKDCGGGDGNFFLGTGGQADISGVELYTGHLYFTTAAPTGTVNTSGAGAAGTCVVTGSDSAHTVTVTTNVADTPAANATICTVTFAATYSSAPNATICQPANAATQDLAYQVVRVQSVGATSYILKSSPTVALPATVTATYAWSCAVMR